MSYLINNKQTNNKKPFTYVTPVIVTTSSILLLVTKQYINNSLSVVNNIGNNIKDKIISDDNSDKLNIHQQRLLSDINNIVLEHDYYHKELLVILNASKKTEYYNKIREVVLLNKRIRKKFDSNNISYYRLERYNNTYTKNFVKLYKLLFNIK